MRWVGINNANLILQFALLHIGFEFCVFVAGWRHALRSEWPFIIIITAAYSAAVSCLVVAVTATVASVHALAYLQCDGQQSKQSWSCGQTSIMHAVPNIRIRTSPTEVFGHFD